MKVRMLKHRREIIVATLCFCLWITPISVLANQDQPQSEQAKIDFKFEKVDLDLFGQVNLLDKRFERDGLVYADEPTNAYLQRVGESLVPRDLKLEHVVWKFRALRDPVPNAFALPNGSIYVNTGVMSLCDNESQLAAILAHEITHVLSRHAYLQNRSKRKKSRTIKIINSFGGLEAGGRRAGLVLGDGRWGRAVIRKS